MIKRSLPLLFFLALVGVLPGGVAHAGAGTGRLDPGKLRLGSANVVVYDAAAQRRLYSKAADDVTPIASLTKLMTAIVILDAKQPMDEMLAIDTDDFDFLKGSHSRLRMGSSCRGAKCCGLH